ncbi:hypothetical protein HR12_15365 [Microbacterium sp. SUBG005]|nr:hypothetical protein HR12_15365 [Microbacterium sp. SUBG005]
MPFRSKDTLQSWLEEFAASGGGGAAFVADQEPVDGVDSGLVIFPLANATTSVYLAPIGVGAPDWRVTFEAQPEVTELSPDAVYDLCREISCAADLCAFLQRKSVEHMHGLAEQAKG